MQIRRTTIQDYHVGDRARFTKTVTETDSALFAAISGDFYPIHFNQELAKRTRFGGRIAHGAIAVGLVSTVIGVPLQGPGVCAAVIKELHFDFTGPVRFGDTLTAEATVENSLTTTFVGGVVPSTANSAMASFAPLSAAALGVPPLATT